jgi:CBS domain containing-hemolysin-like protein
MDHETALLALKVVAIVFLIALNGFFVAAEFAIVRVRGTQIQALARRGSRRARMAQHILNHLDAYLSASQLGITIASILLGWLGEETMTKLVVGPLMGALNVTSPAIVRTTSVVLGTGIIIFLHVVFGEQAPKQFAIQRAEASTLWIAYPLHWFHVMMYPVITVLNKSANFLVRLMGINVASDSEMAHSEEEMRLIIAQGQRSGVLTSEKRDLLENVFDLSRRIVRQIMVPRTEIAAFNLRKSLAENLAVAYRTAHSRYPLVDGELDVVVGVIHMKDLFWQLKEMESGTTVAGEASEEGHNPVIAGGDIASEEPKSGAWFLRKIAREVPFVPETMRIDNLLYEFQTRKVHMAMVVDEYGGTSGMVTFENVIEEIVGEVQDEFDHEAPRIRETAAGEYQVEGNTALIELNDELGVNIQAEDIDTVNGLLLNEFGRIPRPGDKAVIEGVEFTVGEMRKQRIHRITVRLPVSGARKSGK